MSNILYVEVKYNAQSNSLELDPDHLALPPGTSCVIWWPSGAFPAIVNLDVQFQAPNPKGPFLKLIPQDGMVIGSGNSGEEGGYPYVIRALGPGQINPATGELNNRVKERVLDHPVQCTPNPSGPPCYPG